MIPIWNPPTLVGVSWSEFGAGITQAQPRKPSAFVPLRNTYLNIHESIRGQGSKSLGPGHALGDWLMAQQEREHRMD